MDSQVLVNKLVDAMEELFIENRAYRSTLRIVQQTLPMQKQIDQLVEAVKAEPHIRQEVHKLFGPVRDQSLEHAIEYLLQLFPSNKDVN